MFKRIFKARGEFPSLAAVRNELSSLGDRAVRSDCAERQEADWWSYELLFHFFLGVIQIPCKSFICKS